MSYLVKVNLCLPGACMTAFLDPSRELSLDEAVEAVARRYARETGLELSESEKVTIRRKISDGADDSRPRKLA